MKNKALSALFLCLAVLPLSANAQDVIDRSSEAVVRTPVQDPSERMFENVLDQQLTESDDEFFLNGQQQQEMESQLIDPDFLKDEGKVYDNYAKVTLRFLNKITAQSQTFDLEIGKTVAYGSLRIRPMACKKSPPIEEPESASFLQIWEKVHNAQDQWVFSGWMFASSPSVSSMEHPVYDVWVVDCVGQTDEEDTTE